MACLSGLFALLSCGCLFSKIRRCFKTAKNEPESYSIIIGKPTNAKHLLHVDTADIAGTLADGDGFRSIMAPEDLLKWRDRVHVVLRKVQFHLGGGEDDSEGTEDSN